MEPRSAIAYWQNGKCFVYGSTQSQSFVRARASRSLIGVEPDGSRLRRGVLRRRLRLEGRRLSARWRCRRYMAKKIGRPVMMRVVAHEEYFFGSARAGFQGRIKMGFDADGRVTAVDLYIVQENGPNTGFNDWPSAADAVSIVYQPPAMRFRGVPRA